MAAVGGILVAVVVAALAVDLGRIAFEQRRLQGIADAAALDATRAVGPCAGDQASQTLAGVIAAAQDGADRNGYHGQPLGLDSVQVGVTATQDGLRLFTPGPVATADSVRVVARQNIPRSLIAGGFFPGEMTLGAEATARRTAIAGMTLGSAVARLDTDASIVGGVLSGLLGTQVQLDAVSYQGLVHANVSLLELIQAHAVAVSVDALLGTELTIGELLSLMATALQRQGNQTAAATLNDLAALNLAPLSLRLEDLLQVTSGGDAALDAHLNALDLLTLGAQVANGNNAVDIGLAGGDLLSGLGLANLNARVRIIEPPQIRIGRPGRDEQGEWYTEVQTAQVRLQLDLALLPIGGVDGLVNLNLHLDAAPARAALKGIRCAGTADPLHRVTVEVRPGLAQLGVGRYSNAALQGDQLSPSRVVNLLGVATIDARLDARFVSATPTDVELAGPEWPAHDSTSVHPGDALATGLGSLSDSLQFEATLLGIDLLGLLTALVQPVLQILTPVLQELISSLDEPVLVPLLGALGIEVGVADVAIFGVAGSQPHLVQ